MQLQLDSAAGKFSDDALLTNAALRVSLSMSGLVPWYPVIPVEMEPFHAVGDKGVAKVALRPLVDAEEFDGAPARAPQA